MSLRSLTHYLVSNHSTVIVLATIKTNPIPNPAIPLKINKTMKIIWNFTLKYNKRDQVFSDSDEGEELWQGMI